MWQNWKCLQTLPSVSCGTESPWLRTRVSREWTQRNGWSIMLCSRGRTASLRLISSFLPCCLSLRLNPLCPDTQPGTCSRCLTRHSPPNCILLSEYWMGLRARAAGFSPPPPQSVRVLCYFLALPSHTRGGSTLGLFLRLLGSLSFLFSPPCGDQSFLEAFHQLLP